MCSASNPCLNGGVCLVPYLSVGCPPGLTGQDCSTIIDTCASNPCLSPNATCTQTSLNQFKCFCPPYQTGQFCEQSINLCNPNPCPQNIQCVQSDYLNTVCVCPPGK